MSAWVTHISRDTWELNRPDFNDLLVSDVQVGRSTNRRSRVAVIELDSLPNLVQSDLDGKRLGASYVSDQLILKIEGGIS